MQRKTASNLLVTAALVVAPGLAAAAQPQESATPAVASYADLLEPIPNAMERLRASEAEAANRPAELIMVQNAHHHHHHHHHSHAWYRRHGYYFFNGQWVLRPVRPHHHHHHHHHHSNY